MQLHQLLHTSLAKPDASRQQCLPHTRPTLFAMAQSVHGRNRHPQRIVAYVAPATILSASFPRPLATVRFVVTAYARPQGCARYRHRPLSIRP